MTLAAASYSFLFVRYPPFILLSSTHGTKQFNKSYRILIRHGIKRWRND